MTKDEIMAKLQTVFDQVFVEPVIVTDTLCADDVEEWDSLIHIAFVVAVERAFDIRFSLGETEATKNIGEFAELIMRKSEAS